MVSTSRITMVARPKRKTRFDKPRIQPSRGTDQMDCRWRKQSRQVGDENMCSSGVRDIVDGFWHGVGRVAWSEWAFGATTTD